MGLESNASRVKLLERTHIVQTPSTSKFSQAEVPRLLRGQTPLRVVSSVRHILRTLICQATLLAQIVLHI